MFKCRSCKANFEEFKRLLDDSGEIKYVCPGCLAVETEELRSKSEDFFYVEKDFIIETVLSALAGINEDDVSGAKDILMELISDLLGRCLFEYEERLSNVTEQN